MMRMMQMMQRMQRMRRMTMMMKQLGVRNEKIREEEKPSLLISSSVRIQVEDGGGGGGVGGCLGSREAARGATIRALLLSSSLINSPSPALWRLAAPAP